MNLIEYSSDYYGNRPKIHKINTKAEPTQPVIDEGNTSDITVKPPETSEVSEFTLLIIIAIIIFLMWK